METNEELFYTEITPVLTEYKNAKMESTSTEQKDMVLEEEIVQHEDHLYLFYRQGQLRRQPPYDLFDTGRTTPVVWVKNKPRKIIRQSCHARDHISPQCPVLLFELDKVASNIEGFTEKDKKKVSDA